MVSLLLSRDGQVLVSGARDRTIRLWDLAGKKQKQVIPRHLGDSNALTLSGDGKLLAYAGINNTIHIVDPGTGKHLHAGLGSAAPITALGLSADGKILASLGSDHAGDCQPAPTPAWQEPAPPPDPHPGQPGGYPVALALAGFVDGGKIKPGEMIGAGDTIEAMTCSKDGKMFATGHRSGKVGLPIAGMAKVVPW